jgi:Rps23 Pro-64 3,4-dihydroxylase Tpa1-like proline 4-hydroxylase
MGNATLFNPALDLDAIGRGFAVHRRFQIRNVLELPFADALHECLMHKVPWDFAYRLHGRDHARRSHEMRAMSSAEHAALAGQIIAEAGQGFQFAFFKYSMVEAFRSGTLVDPVLHQFIERIASQGTIDAVRRLTADAQVKRVDAQATLYDAGNFLTLHNDAAYAGLKRRFAYVLNLGKTWQADWGGLLHFHNEQGDVIETFVPHFNSMSLFAVPALHSVSFVAPYARSPRLAITGWFTD